MHLLLPKYKVEFKDVNKPVESSNQQIKGGLIKMTEGKSWAIHMTVYLKRQNKQFVHSFFDPLTLA